MKQSNLNNGMNGSEDAADGVTEIITIAINSLWMCSMFTFYSLFWLIVEKFKSQLRLLVPKMDSFRCCLMYIGIWYVELSNRIMIVFLVLLILFLFLYFKIGVCLQWNERKDDGNSVDKALAHTIMFFLSKIVPHKPFVSFPFD